MELSCTVYAGRESPPWNSPRSKIRSTFCKHRARSSDFLHDPGKINTSDDSSHYELSNDLGRIKIEEHFVSLDISRFPFWRAEFPCNFFRFLVCVTKVPTFVPEKKNSRNIWWGLSPGIYGTPGMRHCPEGAKKYHSFAPSHV